MEGLRLGRGFCYAACIESGVGGLAADEGRAFGLALALTPPGTAAGEHLQRARESYPTALDFLPA